MFQHIQPFRITTKRLLKRYLFLLLFVLREISPIGNAISEDGAENGKSQFPLSVFISGIYFRDYK
jgi:hypothetical protein